MDQGFGAAWIKVRSEYLRSRRFCIKCAGLGLQVAATTVGHVRPHDGDEALLWDRTNWQALCEAHRTVGGEAEAASPLGSLVARRMIYARKGVAWASSRAWRHDVKRADIDALRAVKARLDRDVIAGAAKDVSALVGLLFGSLPGWMVSTTAVGHSRRPDSFAVRLAEAVAGDLGRPFAKVFSDRFVTGSSHPKGFANLPVLQLCREVMSPVLLVDDVATSGWHMEEALTKLRGLGVSSFGAVWICGTVR